MDKGTDPAPGFGPVGQFLIHVATFTRDGIRLRFHPTSPCSQAETEALHERLM